MVKAFGLDLGPYSGEGRAMDEKMKSCFTPHVMMHSLFGLGLGIWAVAGLPGLGGFWLDLVVLTIAGVWTLPRNSWARPGRSGATEAGGAPGVRRPRSAGPGPSR